MHHIYLICLPQECKSACCTLLKVRAKLARALADHAGWLPGCGAAIAAQKAFADVAEEDHERAERSFGTVKNNTASKAASGKDVHLQASAVLLEMQRKIGHTLNTIKEWSKATVRLGL
jgi:hypothetical protein